MNARRYTCFHEAGHVVACLARGGMIRRVYVDSDQTGMTHTCTPCNDETLRAYNGVLVCLAGMVAENMARGLDAADIWESTDMENAREYLSRLADMAPKVELLLKQALSDLVDFFYLPVVWQRVEAVAAALERYGELDGHEVDHVIKRAERAKRRLVC